MITVEIPGEPQAQARQRHRLVRTRDGRQFVTNYQPAECRNWKATAQEHMRTAMGERAPYTGAVALVISAFFACPRSQWRTRTPLPARWKIGKPDLDNCAKAVMDSAIGVLFLDDAQVVDLRVQKIVAAQGEPARVVVEVRELGALAGERPAAATGELAFARSAEAGGGR